VDPAAQAVGPVHPWPPHWPYLVCVAPGAEDVVVVGLLVVVITLVVVALVVVPVVGVDPAGAVGTVLGWSAVFQVAVVGHAVAATAGDAIAYGEGPGMV